MRLFFASFFILLAYITLNAGCATIFTGTKQNVHFDSAPPGAKVIVNGIEMGRTPTTLHLSKPGFGSTMVTLRLEGYEDRTFILDKSFNGISVLNLLGLVGWVVDFATGAFMNYSPEGYNMSLTQKAHAAIKKELGVEEVVMTNSLKSSDNGLIIGPSLAGKKVAIIDQKTNLVLVLK